MRIPVIVGNWKMNTTVTEAEKLVHEMLGIADGWHLEARLASVRRRAWIAETEELDVVTEIHGELGRPLEVELLKIVRLVVDIGRIDDAAGRR